MKGKPALLQCTRHSHTDGKKQLVLLQPTCPYGLAADCAVLFWLVSRFGSDPPEIHFLVLGLLGLGHPDTSVPSGLGAIPMRLSIGGNAAGMWGSPPETESTQEPVSYILLFPQIPQHSHTHPVENSLFAAGRTSCPGEKSQQKSDPRIQMLGLMQIWLDDAVFPQLFCLPLPPCPSPAGLTSQHLFS